MINFLAKCSLCNDNAIFSVVYIFKQILQVIFVLVPIVLIVLVLIDIVKNVVAGKEDDMKKNKNIAIKRIIYAIVIFFVPTIVNIFMRVMYDVVDNGSEASFLSCWNNATLDNVKICNNEALKEEEQNDNLKKQKSDSKINQYDNEVDEKNNSREKGLSKGNDDNSGSENDSNSESSDEKLDEENNDENSDSE